MTRRNLGTAALVAGVVLGLALTLLATPAQAYITRSCQAAYMIRETGTSSDWIRREFRTTGKNFINPNAARSDARQRLERCLDAHWAAPDAASRPSLCTMGPSVGVRDYPFDALRDEITDLVCATWPGRARIVVDVQVHVSGDTGCTPGNRWAIGVVAAYPVHCPVVRSIDPATGAVPRQLELLAPPLPSTRLPGLDIRTQVMPGATWQQCAGACRDEPLCRAWTFRPHDPAGPVCLLKRGVPEPVSDSCCSSGVKE